MAVQYVQPLCIAKQLETAPEHWVVARLAGVAGNRPSLREPVNWQSEVELDRRATTEGRPELEVDSGRNVLGQSPGYDREIAARGDYCLCGPDVVGMTGDATFVKDEEQIGIRPFDHGHNILAEHLDGDGCEHAIRIVEKAHHSDSEHSSRTVEFVPAHPSEIAVDAMQGGGFAVRETEQGRVGSELTECADHRTEPERLVIWVRHNGENAGGERPSTAHRSGRSLLNRRPSRSDRGERVAHVVHVERTYLRDEILEHRGRQGAGLGEHQDAVPKRHERRDGHDPRATSELPIGLRVDLREDDLVMLQRGGLEGWCKGATGSAS
jgi:hypothetical protein